MIIGLALLLVCAFLLLRLLSYRRAYKRLKDPFPSPIPRVEPDRFDPAFIEDSLGPTLASEVHFIGVGTARYASTSDREAWILAVLAKSCPDLIFEFGTATGRTSYLLARNAPPSAKLVTLTLAPAQIADYEPASGDSDAAQVNARQESEFGCFRYTGTSVEGRIEQRYGDSKQFDETPFHGRCDLIFIDGSHAYSYVKSDTDKALRMIKPGGTILWHDYRGERDPDTADVYRYLVELSVSLQLVCFQGTALVAHRAPG